MGSSKFSLVLFFIIFVALVGGIFFYASRKTQKNATTNTLSQTASPTPAPALPQGTSDSQLNQDSTQIDNSMNSLNSDTTTIDQGLNDQQTNLQ